MKPNRLHYVAAHGIKICLSGCSLAAALWSGWEYDDFLTPTSWISWLCFFAGIIVCALLGCILGALFIWPIVFQLCSRFNGAPFHNGDQIRILIGPHRDRVTHVYELWPSRGEVRVDLGEEAGKKAADVFGANEICREKESDFPDSK